MSCLSGSRWERRALGVIGQGLSLHFSVQGNFFSFFFFFSYMKLQEIGLGHFVISETLFPGDNRC